jgi:hypothetical protein
MPASKRTDYKDMLNAHNDKKGSGIVMEVWLQLWVEVGGTRIPMGEKVERNGKMVTNKTKFMQDVNPLWNRHEFLTRLVAENNKLNTKDNRDDDHKDDDCSIESVDALRLHKDHGGKHGGDARVSQLFGYARKQLAKAIGIHSSQLSRLMALPPIEGESSVGADPTDWKALLGGLGVETDYEVDPSFQEPWKKS